jgi:hypothetical protein
MNAQAEERNDALDPINIGSPRVNVPAAVAALIMTVALLAAVVWAMLS